MKGKKVCWKTAQEIFKSKKFDVIKQGISSHDIYQGHIGDCYFLCSLSAIAEYPERIRRLLLTKKKNTKGIYAVAVCYCGVWKKVHLDSYFPLMDGKELFGAHSDQAELWVLLLEKAYAKMFSGYWNIGHGGSGYRAMKDMTSAPAERFTFEKFKKTKSGIN